MPASRARYEKEGIYDLFLVICFYLAGKVTSSRAHPWRLRCGPVWRVRIRFVDAGASEGPDQITRARPIPDNPGHAIGVPGRGGSPGGDSGAPLAARHSGGV